MGLFLQQEKVALLQGVRCREPTHTAAYDHHVVPSRYRRLGKDFSIAHLVTDLVVLALHGGCDLGRSCHQGQVHRASRSHGASHNKLDEVPAICAQNQSPCAAASINSAATSD